MTGRPQLWVAVALASLLTVLSCGSNSDGGSEPAAATTTAASPTSAATAAADTRTLRGEFGPVPGAPPSAQSVTGTVEQTRTAQGATVSLQLSGLAPDTEYIAHLHAGSCDMPDPGGPHFKFDPAGSDMPPNEVHLQWTSDRDGTGAASTEVARPLPEGEAMTVVVHEQHGGAGHHDTPKIACAEVS